MGVLIAFLISWLTGRQLGWPAGIIIGSLLFTAMQSIIAVYVLRMNRGQYVDQRYLTSHILPAIPTLIAASFLLAIMGLVGFSLFLLPGLLLLSIYSFMPFLIVDRRMNIIEAFHASRMLTLKRGIEYFGAIMGVVFVASIGAGTIMLIPLTLPLTAAALADMYDELGH